MNKKLIGLLAGTSLAVAGAAFAQSDVSPSSSSSSSKTTVKKSEKKSEKGTGGSMGTSSETMGSAQGQNEITGQVIQKKGSTVYVQDQMGAVVQLKTDKSTKFEGVKRNELKEGDQIRASFDVRHKTENLALSISLQPGTGGTSNLGSKEGSPMEEKGESPQQERQEQMGQPSGPSGSPSDMGSGKGGSGSSSQSGEPDQSNY